MPALLNTDEAFMGAHINNFVFTDLPLKDNTEQAFESILWAMKGHQYKLLNVFSFSLSLQ